MEGVDANMPHAEKKDSSHEPQVFSIDSKEKKGGYRQDRAGKGDTQEGTVKIGQGFLASEVSQPIEFIENHQYHGPCQPEAPGRPRPQVEVLKNQGKAGDENLAGFFENY